MQPGFGTGLPPGQFPSGGFAFEANGSIGAELQLLQQAQRPPGLGFGQAPVPAFGQNQSHAGTGGFAFGHTPPPAAALSSGGLSFGQPVPQQGQHQLFGAPPAQQPPQQQQQQQQLGGTGFAFGQQQSAAPEGSAFSFGAQPQATAAFATAARPGGFAYRESAPLRLSAAAPAFDFGSSLRKAPQQQTPASPPPPSGTHLSDDEAAFDYETAKREALMAAPAFAGSGGAFASGRVARPPPPRGRGRGGGGGRGSSSADGAEEDPQERARRLSRAARFANAAPAAPAALPAARPPALPPSGAYVAPALRASPAAAAAFAGEEGGEEGGDDGVGGGARSAIVGTCEDMCPPAERDRRQSMADIQFFERVDPANPSLTSPDLAVRRFARTVDAPHPSEFRTRGAIVRTMEHLRCLLDRTDVRFGLVHKFLWDRYRSVRQDLYIQGITDDFGVAIFEEIVRFHILCEHELCGEDQSVTEMEGFNSHLNVEQMNKALISLNEMYSKAEAEGRPQPNEAEFRSYHLLSLMARHGKFKGDQLSLLSTLQELRPEVRGAPPVQWVLKLQRALTSGNFVRFFLLVQEAPYLLACAAHTHFPTARGRALRLLSETLSPGAAVPARVELPWLQRSLALDSEQEARQLCMAHGFAEFIETGGVVAVSLYRGAYVDPPPPIARRPSALVSAKAPPSRSLAVATPAAAPLSPQEIAELQERQREALRRQQEAAKAARAAAAADAERRRAAAQAAAAEEAQRRAEAEKAAQHAEQERLADAHRQQDEARRAQERAAQEEARRQAEAHAAAHRQAEAARAAAAATAKAAADAEARRRIDEERRRAAEEAERRWLAEIERQRIEAERRQQEEERRRLEAEHLLAVQRRFYYRWVAEMRRRVVHRRRQERIAASLKSCRVGVASAPKGVSAEEVEATEEALGGLDLERGSAEAKRAQRGALDLPALVAPLLLPVSPDAQSLLWKVAVLAAGAGSRVSPLQQHEQQNLLRWLGVQLSGGRVAAAAAGSAYVQGPVALRVEGAAACAELATCAVLPALTSAAPPSTGCSALSGAAGVIVAAASPDAESVAGIVQALPALPVPVLVLVAAGTDAAVEQLQDDLQAMALGHPVRAVTLAAPHRPPSTATAASFSAYQLVQGLRWLAGNAVQQPALSVTRLEDAARDALTAALAPLLRDAGGGSASTASLGGTQSHQPQQQQQQQFVAAFNHALELVAAALQAAAASPEAAWRWPPPELCEGPLMRWHHPSPCRALMAALEALQGSTPAALGLTAGSTLRETAVALHSRLGALAAQQVPVVLPLGALVAFQASLAAAEQRESAAAATIAAHRLLTEGGGGGQQHGAGLLRQKRKWRHSPDNVGSMERAATGPAIAAEGRLPAGLAALLVELPEERSLMRSFAADATRAAGGGALVDIARPSRAVAEHTGSHGDGDVGMGPGSGGVLVQQLCEVGKERQAAETVWGKVRSMAAAAWLF